MDPFCARRCTPARTHAAIGDPLADQWRASARRGSRLHRRPNGTSERPTAHTVDSVCLLAVVARRQWPMSAFLTRGCLFSCLKKKHFLIGRNKRAQPTRLGSARVKTGGHQRRRYAQRNKPSHTTPPPAWNATETDRKRPDSVRDPPRAPPQILTERSSLLVTLDRRTAS